MLRALSFFALALTLTTGALAQDATLPTDGFLLVAVPADALPDGYVESLPALPADATILSESPIVLSEVAPSLGYELPAETVALASEKDPTIGLLLSILVTGGGHFYAGETTKGLILLGIGVGAYVAGAALSDSDNLTPLYLGAVVSLGAWVYGIIDGMKAVERYNAANGFALAPAPIRTENGVGLGLAMRTRF